MRDKLLIVGAGGFGRVVLEHAVLEYDCAFIDDGPELGTLVNDIPVIGRTTELGKFSEEYKKLIVAIGNNKFREEVYKRAEVAGFEFPNIIDPSAYISPYATLGKGVIILNNAVVQNNAIIGNGTILNSGVDVLTLDRAATNPHAGKTIIELYSSGGYVEDNISEAIVKYNNTSSTHYIEVRDRYSNVNSGIDYSKITSDDEMQTADLNFNAKMSNELAMDILNGEGPDILLNCSNYGQLNNTNYLADLSKYVGTLDSDKYFTNIVDAAKIDGKLYQFPVCYMVSGIFTDAKYAGKSGVGFTTAE